MKKKPNVSSQDKKDWIAFTKDMGNISTKENDLINKNIKVNKIPKLDLHRFSLEQANKEVKKFIIQSFDDGHKKLLIVTGKGSKSKAYDNPYLSEKLSILTHSVPEYIKTDENLVNKISKITPADLKDGGDGSIYVFLKMSGKLKNKF